MFESSHLSMQRWKDRVAVVTGASAGIGAAVARTLAADGMRVVACARRLERLDSLAGSDAGRRILPVRCDVRKESDVAALFGRVRAEWGGVDVLVNNAGLGHRAPLVGGRPEDWREMLETNVLGLCFCTSEAVQDMRRRGDDGHVLHLSSMAGHRVPPQSGVYSASKFAVRALTEALRQELRALESKIRVTAISPGFVETEFAEHYDKSKEAAARTYGRFKVLEPADVAETVRYVLACPPHVQVHDVLIRPRDQKN